jgi:Xaa-Pro aminopeptidase
MCCGTGRGNRLNLQPRVTSALLLRALAVSRAVKLPQEIELIAAATRASLRAHAIVQRRAAPGDSEGKIAALFRFSNEDCGLPFQA